MRSSEKVGLVILALLLAAAPARAADKAEVQHDASLSLDYDTNVYNSFTDPEDDLLGRLFYFLQASYRPRDAHLLSAGYQLGAKKFVAISRQDTIVNLGRAGYAFLGLSDSALGTELEAKLRNVRDGREDFGKYNGEVYFEHWFPKRFRLRLDGETTWFDHWKYAYFDYWLQRYGLAVGKGFTDYLTVGFHYRFENKLFRVRAFTNIGSRDEVILKESGRRRIDNAHEVGADLEWSRWLLARFAYAFEVVRSNSYGDSYYNHQLLIALSKAILDPLSVHALGIFQFRDGLDPVLIPTTLQIEETDETFNQVTGKVTYRLTDWLSLDAKYSRFWNQYSDREETFHKDLYSLGLDFRF